MAESIGPPGVGLESTKSEEGFGDAIRQRKYQLIPQRLDESGRDANLSFHNPGGCCSVTRSDIHQDIINDLHGRLTCTLVFVSITILMGSTFIFGFSMSVLNNPGKHVMQFINRTYSQRRGRNFNQYTVISIYACATTFYPVGACIASFCFGWFVDALGRKSLLLLIQVPFIIGGVMCTISFFVYSPECLIIGRLIVGFAGGLGANLAPLYLMELSPVNYRGAFGTSSQLFITFGIFIGSVLGLTKILGGYDTYSYIFLIAVAVTTFVVIIIPFLPESPRYLLMMKGDKAAAERVLRLIRGKEDVSADIAEMETEFQSEMESKKNRMSILQLVKSRSLRWPLFVACFLMVIQQLSGINAVIFYSSQIFEKANVPAENIEYATCGTMAINFVTTIIAVPIMDRVGRRPLLLYPMALMNITFVGLVLAIKYQDVSPGMAVLGVVMVFLFVICFAIGLGPIPWMLTGEIFRQGSRGAAMSLASVVHGLFVLIVGQCFQVLELAIGFWVFLIFLILMMIFTIFVFFFIPETKNKTFEEIAAKYYKGDDVIVVQV